MGDTAVGLNILRDLSDPLISDFSSVSGGLAQNQAGLFAPAPTTSM